MMAMSCRTNLFLSAWRAKEVSKKRRRFVSEFKFRVALESAKGTRTIGELANEHSVHAFHLLFVVSWS